jgi:flagellar L-ring protein precursor FlgH
MANPEGKIINPYMQATSYLAVNLPTRRLFNVHDLVTIVVRESSSATVDGDLNTKKESKIDGEVTAMVDLKQILTDLRIAPTGFNAGNPKVGVSVKPEFKGTGTYDRSDVLTTRLTAEVVDVKPNGILSLQARTYMANDDEELTITVTGYCRAEDITADNTVLSTQMYDLRLSKQHQGEIRNVSKKGLLTKALETIFNF